MFYEFLWNIPWNHHFPLWNQHFFHGETPKPRQRHCTTSRASARDRPKLSVPAQLIPWDSRTILRQFYCKNKGRTIFLGKRMVELCWTIKIYIYISKISMKNKNHCSWVEIFCGFIWKWLGLSERYLGLWSQALLFGNGVYSSIPTYFELNFLNYSHSCPRIKNPSLINWGGSFQIVMICDLLLKWYPENRHLGMT